MKTTETGKQAEAAIARYLKANGFKVLAQNWRTRFCEIDVVAQKDACVYFVEVKHRARDSWGSGLEYITAKKQKQMSFAAEYWVATNNWSGEYCLAAAETSGPDYKVMHFLTDL